MKVALKNEPYLKAIVKAAFPTLNKRAAHVRAFYAQGENVNSFWDGGSKTEFAIVHLPTLKARPLPTSTHPFFDIAAQGAAATETADLVADAAGNVTLKRLPAEFALVYTGHYCGTQSIATVVFAPEQAQATIAVAQQRALDGGPYYAQTGGAK